MVKLWDAITGVLYSILKGYLDWVKAVSLDGQLLTFALGNKMIKLWNANTGVYSILKGHSSWVNVVAFLLDS